MGKYPETESEELGGIVAGKPAAQEPGPIMIGKNKYEQRMPVYIPGNPDTDPSQLSNDLLKLVEEGQAATAARDQAHQRNNEAIRLKNEIEAQQPSTDGGTSSPETIFFPTKEKTSIRGDDGRNAIRIPRKSTESTS